MLKQFLSKWSENYFLLTFTLLILVVVAIFTVQPPQSERLTEIKSITISSYSIKENPLCWAFSCPEVFRLYLTTDSSIPYSLPLVFKDDPLVPNRAYYVNLLDKAFSEGSITLKYYTMDKFTCAYGLYDSKGNVLYDLSEVHQKFVTGDFNNSTAKNDWMDLLPQTNPFNMSKRHVDNLCFKYKNSLLLDEAY